MNGTPLVGLAPNISLSRRVQLAVLAHIRHTHTRYDHLLRETSYVNARKAVETLCLDILVKWRGDEETGRDQLDEILREVVVISDSEDEGEDAEDEDEGESSDSTGDTLAQASLPERVRMQRLTTVRSPGPSAHPEPTVPDAPYGFDGQPAQVPQPRYLTRAAKRDRRAEKKAQRGFFRYQAVRDQVWQDAVERQRPAGYEPAIPPTAPGQVPETRPPMLNSHNSPVYYTSPMHDNNSFFIRRDNPHPVLTPHTRLPPDPDKDPGGGSYSDEPSSLIRSSARPNLVQPPPTPRSMVSYRNEDGRNFLVRSIEPQSPEASHSQYPVSRTSLSYYSEREALRLSPPVGMPPQRAVPYYLPPGSPAHRQTLDERRGYITLSDGSGSSRPPTDVARHGGFRDALLAGSGRYSTAYSDPNRFSTASHHPTVSDSLHPPRGTEGRINSHMPAEFVPVSGAFPKPYAQPHADYVPRDNNHGPSSVGFGGGYRDMVDGATERIPRREFVPSQPFDRRNNYPPEEKVVWVEYVDRE